MSDAHEQPRISNPSEDAVRPIRDTKCQVKSTRGMQHLTAGIGPWHDPDRVVSI
jgi:hypothetical protein